MQKQNYHNHITVDISPADAFDKITRVPEWWGTDFQGKSRSAGDVFTIRFWNGDSYTIQLAEVVPDEKIVWKVIDSVRPSLKEPNEWTGTQIVWEITSQGSATRIDMTHEGLVPEIECYEVCSRGWTFLIDDSLLHLITDNQGKPVRLDGKR